MQRRTGMTLIEVLVAIFIMAIGLIALLTLFPIGMLRLAQAIRDDRCVQSAVNAHSLSVMNNIGNDPAVITDGTPQLPDLFVNPGPLNAGKKVLPDADDYGESYPILVDHIGYLNTGGSPWVGGVPGILRRRPVSYLPLLPPFVEVYKNFTLWDDMSFDSINIPGTPEKVPATNLVLRDSRFSWAYLLRRAQTSNRAVVDCTVIVFDQRSLSLTANLQLEEYVYTGNTGAGTPAAKFELDKNSIVIDYTGYVQPPIRAGDWILDTTFYSAKPNTGAANAFFYRVVEFDELPNNQIRYEVQQPIRGWPAQQTRVLGGTWYQGTAIVTPGIAEVFEKGPARLP